MGNPLGDDTGYTGEQSTTGGQEQGQQQPGINPAWNDFLKDVPQDLHPKVIPHLQEWDKKVNTRFETIQSQIKPWESVTKSGMTPDEVMYSAQLLDALNKNPRMVYDAIGSYYEYAKDASNQGVSGQGPTVEPQNTDDPYAPKFTAFEQQINELKHQNDLLARAQQVQIEQRLQQQADVALDSELKSLKARYGDYDENYVLALMSNGASGDDAVKAYQGLAQKLGGGSAPRPLILGGGSGGIPGNNSVDVRKASDQDVKGLVASMLESYKRGNQ